MNIIVPTCFQQWHALTMVSRGKRVGKMEVLELNEVVKPIELRTRTRTG